LNIILKIFSTIVKKYKYIAAIKTVDMPLVLKENIRSILYMVKNPKGITINQINKS
jgi:hypothetical protein